MNRFTTRLHMVPHAKLKKKRTFKDFKEQRVTQLLLHLLGNKTANCSFPKNYQLLKSANITCKIHHCRLYLTKCVLLLLALMQNSLYSSTQVYSVCNNKKITQ